MRARLLRPLCGEGCLLRLLQGDAAVTSPSSSHRHLKISPSSVHLILFRHHLPHHHHHHHHHHYHLLLRLIPCCACCQAADAEATAVRLNYAALLLASALLSVALLGAWPQVGLCYGAGGRSRTNFIQDSLLRAINAALGAAPQRRLEDALGSLWFGGGAARAR